MLADQLSVWLVATFVAPLAGTGFNGAGGGNSTKFATMFVTPVTGNVAGLLVLVIEPEYDANW